MHFHGLKKYPPPSLLQDLIFHDEKSNPAEGKGVGGIFFILVIVGQKTSNFDQIHEVSSMHFLLKHRISSLTCDARVSKYQKLCQLRKPPLDFCTLKI